MRWVNETLPPRPRARWLLITIRLSLSSFAGTDRTLVAVGTVRLAAMFSAVRAAAPRSRTPVAWDAASADGSAAARGWTGAAGAVGAPGAAGAGGCAGAGGSAVGTGLPAGGW